jgi:hypothetical protein
MRIRDENTAVKATLKEMDRSREMMVKEISHMKDIENDKMREAERRLGAEIKVLEKIIESMKKEKKEMEERIDDLMMKYELVKNKAAEEHHETVKYFENVVGSYKQ